MAIFGFTLLPNILQGGQHFLTPLQKGTFHQLFMDRPAVGTGILQEAHETKASYTALKPLFLHFIYKLQIQSRRNQSTWQKHWMYRHFQATEKMKKVLAKRVFFVSYADSSSLIQSRQT